MRGALGLMFGPFRNGSFRSALCPDTVISRAMRLLYSFRDGDITPQKQLKYYDGSLTINSLRTCYCVPPRRLAVWRHDGPALAGKSVPMCEASQPV